MWKSAQQVPALAEVNAVGGREEGDGGERDTGTEEPAQGEKAEEKREQRDHEAGEDDALLCHAERDPGHGEQPRDEIGVMNIEKAKGCRIGARRDLLEKEGGQVPDLIAREEYRRRLAGFVDPEKSSRAGPECHDDPQDPEQEDEHGKRCHPPARYGFLRGRGRIEPKQQECPEGPGDDGDQHLRIAEYLEGCVDRPGGRDRRQQAEEGAAVVVQPGCGPLRPILGRSPKEPQRAAELCRGRHRQAAAGRRSPAVLMRGGNAEAKPRGPMGSKYLALFAPRPLAEPASPP